MASPSSSLAFTAHSSKDPVQSAGGSEQRVIVCSWCLFVVGREGRDDQVI